MRTRSIKPGFFDNDILGDLPALTRLLFIGLWCMADREGRLEDRPKKVKKALLGYDDVSTDDVSEMLQKLHDSGFIILYEAQGKRYIQVVNFAKHQNPHIKEKDSEIPPPTQEYGVEPQIDSDDGEEDNEHHTSTVQAPDKNSISTEEAPPITGTLLLVPDYRLPSTGNARAREEIDEPPKAQEATNANRFDLFWAAYPRKVGKKATQKAWKNANVNSALFNKIMTAVGFARTTKEWKRENGRYIPNPSTWLNQGRWDDEYDDEYEEVGQDAEHRNDTRGYGQEHISEKARGGSLAKAGFKVAGGDAE